ncbi:YcxB family protein [Novosphingobium resinovorum]|uniref:YcxB family protein n=1 Tax=Novosphingobium resinovorum TaxID=158500 RepID=UPI002ED3AB29|nr:YcxB family protein [Novosphingobium resinovorum]
MTHSFTISLDYENYLAANWLMVRRRMWWRGLARTFATLFVVYAFVMFAVGAILDGVTLDTLFYGLGTGLVFATLMMIVLPLCWLWKLPRSARKTWPQLHLDGLPTLHEFDETGIRIANDRGSSNFDWHMLASWAENDDLLLMFRTKLMFHAVPKAQVAPETLQALRARLIDAGVSTRC